MLKIDKQQIILEVGKSKYKKILERLNNEKISYKIDNSLEIIIESNEEKIIFLPNLQLKHSLEEIILNYKSKTMHEYKILAIMFFIKNIIGEEKFNEEYSVDIDLETNISMEYVFVFIEEILKQGLFLISKQHITNCKTLATVSHGKGFANIERTLNRIAGEMEKYIERNIEFSLQNLYKNLLELYSDCIQMESGKDLEKVIGSFKKEYFEIDRLNLSMIGSKIWSGSSGFSGYTSYFYNDENNSIYSFVVTQKNLTIKNIESSYKSNLYWKSTKSAKQMKNYNIQLTNCKISKDKTISSSNLTSCIIGKRYEIENLNNIICNSRIDIINYLEKNEDEESYKCILKTKKMEKGRFDSINQIFLLELIAEDNSIINCLIHYNNVNENIILNLEYMIENKIYPEYVFIDSLIKNGNLIVFSNNDFLYKA